MKSAQVRRLQRNIAKGERTVTPEDLRVNAGWSVKPEYKEYIRQQAEKQNLSASRYVENLIVADMEMKSMLENPEVQEALKSGYKDMMEVHTSKKPRSKKT
jgi:uridine kinase